MAVTVAGPILWRRAGCRVGVAHGVVVSVLIAALIEHEWYAVDSAEKPATALRDQAHAMRIRVVSILAAAGPGTHPGKRRAIPARALARGLGVNACEADKLC